MLSSSVEQEREREPTSVLNVFSLTPEIPQATQFGASAMDQITSWLVHSVSQGFSVLKFV